MSSVQRVKWKCRHFEAKFIAVNNKCTVSENLEREIVVMHILQQFLHAICICITILKVKCQWKMNSSMMMLKLMALKLT